MSDNLIRTLEEAEEGLPKPYPAPKVFTALLGGIVGTISALEVAREHSWACILLAGVGALYFMIAGFIISQNEAARAIAALRARDGGGNG